MTIVSCEKCGRPGLMCQCKASAGGTLFGLEAANYAKWAVTKSVAEPLTLARIHEAIEGVERRAQWAEIQFHEWMARGLPK